MPILTRPQQVLDTVLVAWVVAWAAIGLWVALEVRHLGDVSASVKSVGGAVVQAGDAIGSLRDLPLVGGTASKGSESIRAAGRDAQATAQDARSSANRLAVLLGLCIAVIPSAPLLLMRFTRVGCQRCQRCAVWDVRT